MSCRARLTINPKSASLDQVISIRVDELFPGEKIVITADLIDETNRRWHAEGCFKADSSGRVDLARDAPLSGTYNHVDPMGLFWSMCLDQAEQDRNFFRYRCWDPMVARIQVKRVSGETQEKIVERRMIDHPLCKKIINEDGVVANFIVPQGDGPFPGVIILGGGWPEILPDSFVSQFADKGYAALGLSYHSQPGLPPRMSGIPVEYLHAAIVWMKKHRKINTDKLAVVGYSVGGSFGLLGASYYSDIKVVVSLLGRGVVPQTFNVDPPSSVFTAAGKPLPFIFEDKKKYKGSSFKSRMILDALINASDELIESVSIQVERIQGAILLIGAIDDQRVPTVYFGNMAYNRLVASRFSYPYEFLVYKGAGHLTAEAGFPYQPTTALAAGNFGGNPRDQAAANVSIWKNTFNFLDVHVKQALRFQGESL